ncbi:hypothetical protein AQUCO_00300681v1 [Aquilegia coerulea]|uniref:Uncharacterized protein n=1 Tax=Aquilegia coerulea TaxID=218851 RepID=A0A2G5EZX7_AQUCA|nr:hypothetical protein AQUCO_00300681v1 [Aquilegia coerulea]
MSYRLSVNGHWLDFSVILRSMPVTIQFSFMAIVFHVLGYVEDECLSVHISTIWRCKPIFLGKLSTLVFAVII